MFTHIPRALFRRPNPPAPLDSNVTDRLPESSHRSLDTDGLASDNLPVNEAGTASAEALESPGTPDAPPWSPLTPPLPVANSSLDADCEDDPPKEKSNEEIPKANYGGKRWARPKSPERKDLRQSRHRHNRSPSRGTHSPAISSTTDLPVESDPVVRRTRKSVELGRERRTFADDEEYERLQRIKRQGMASDRPAAFPSLAIGQLLGSDPAAGTDLSLQSYGLKHDDEEFLRDRLPGEDYAQYLARSDGFDEEEASSIVDSDEQSDDENQANLSPCQSAPQTTHCYAPNKYQDIVNMREHLGDALMAVAYYPTPAFYVPTEDGPLVTFSPEDAEQMRHMDQAMGTTIGQQAIDEGILTSHEPHDLNSASERDWPEDMLLERLDPRVILIILDNMIDCGGWKQKELLKFLRVSFEDIQRIHEHQEQRREEDMLTARNEPFLGSKVGDDEFIDSYYLLSHRAWQQGASWLNAWGLTSRYFPEPAIILSGKPMYTHSDVRDEPDLRTKEFPHIPPPVPRDFAESSGDAVSVGRVANLPVKHGKGQIMPRNGQVLGKRLRDDASDDQTAREPAAVRKDQATAVNTRESYPLELGAPMAIKPITNQVYQPGTSDGDAFIASKSSQNGLSHRPTEDGSPRRPSAPSGSTTPEEQTTSRSITDSSPATSNDVSPREKQRQEAIFDATRAKPGLVVPSNGDKIAQSIEGEPPAKRPRGRPPGSKDKKPRAKRGTKQKRVGKTTRSTDANLDEEDEG